MIPGDQEYQDDKEEVHVDKVTNLKDDSKLKENLQRSLFHVNNRASARGQKFP